MRFTGITAIFKEISIRLVFACNKLSRVNVYCCFHFRRIQAKPRCGDRMAQEEMGHTSADSFSVQRKQFSDEIL